MAVKVLQRLVMFSYNFPRGLMTRKSVRGDYTRRRACPQLSIRTRRACLYAEFYTQLSATTRKTSAPQAVSVNGRLREIYQQLLRLHYTSG